MMKKLLKLLLTLVGIALLTAGFFVFNRYRQNPQQIFPYPYTFNFTAEPVNLEAPILIIGDRMAQYLARFQAELAQGISVNLDKPIKTQSIAKAGEALHRTLHSLKGLNQWPQILIYQGGSEEFSERKFQTNQMQVMLENIKLYQDDRIETFLVLWPILSRFLYHPHQRLNFSKEIKTSPILSENEYLNRLSTELLLYEQELIQLVNLSKDRGSLLILSTTPINLESAPKKSCSISVSIEVEKAIDTIKTMMAEGNRKTLYPTSSRLIKQFEANAELYYLHAQVAALSHRWDEAKEYYLKASAYDCQQWRSNELTNSIIRRVAKQHQVILFDFHKVTEQDLGKNITFTDEIFPQDLYYEKGLNQLALLIKGILKL